jgi:UDP-N-acetylmuramate dehydrogenase
MDMTEPTNFQDLGLRGLWTRDEPMAKHVSWRAGGVAAHSFRPADLDDLIGFLQLAPKQEPVYFVGLGSNLLVRDGGYAGTVVFTHGVLDGIDLMVSDRGETLLYAQSGVAAPKVARYAARHGLAGAEFMAGVPGTVGGALAMNAGCYGSETWDVVDSVTTLTRGGMLRERRPSDFEIGYRHVALRATSQAPGARIDDAHASPHASRPTPHEEFFIAARFRLAPGDGELSRQKITDLLSRRIATQPLGQPNAGSVFRNPPGDHAARLIETSGLKGYRIGGAEVSTKHGNFIVNVGGASAADIEAVIEHVQATVSVQQGVELIREVRIIGERS